MKNKLFFTLICLFCSLLLLSQTEIDNFENGLNNWEYYYTIYPDYTGWDLVSGDGIKELCTTEYYQGNYSLQLADFSEINGATMCINTSILLDYCIYTAWIKMIPNNSINMSTDGLFYFQFKNLDEHYVVTIYPADSDNPGIRLRKTIDGISTLIGSSTPLTVFGNWYKLIIERHCSGNIIIKIYDPIADTETEAINIVDNSIYKEGYVGVGSFSTTVFWDEIGFDELSVLSLDETSDLQLNIYPNPANNSLFINNPLPNAEYSIFDLTGNILNNGNINFNSIDISGLSSGIYFLSVKSDNKIFNQKFIKTVK